jgi:hypothetical protein
MSLEHVVYIHNGVLLSYKNSIPKRNEIMLLEGKWMKLEDVMLSEVSQVQKDKHHVFSPMGKTDPKDKCIHKNKMIIYTFYIEHACNNRTILWNEGEEGKEKRMTENQ